MLRIESDESNITCGKWSTSGEAGPLFALAHPILAFSLYPPVATEIGGGSLGHKGGEAEGPHGQQWHWGAGAAPQGHLWW